MKHLLKENVLKVVNLFKFQRTLQLQWTIVEANDDFFPAKILSFQIRKRHISGRKKNSGGKMKQIMNKRRNKDFFPLLLFSLVKREKRQISRLRCFFALFSAQCFSQFFYHSLLFSHSFVGSYWKDYILNNWKTAQLQQISGVNNSRPTFEANNNSAVMYLQWLCTPSNLFLS